MEREKKWKEGVELNFCKDTDSRNWKSSKIQGEETRFDIKG